MERHVNPLLHELVQQGAATAEGVARLAQEHDFPLLDGQMVTFVFVGEADEVRLRNWIWGLDGSLPFQRIEGTALWYRELELPPKSRVEYKIEVRRGDSNEWILDPLNPHRARDPFGANSICHAAGYQPPEWALPDERARRGTIDAIDVQSAAFGQTRQVPVYLPARFSRARRYPVLLVHDGDDYVHYASLRHVLDNLIDRLEISQVVVALCNPGDRLREYADDERNACFLVDELLPALAQRFPLRTRPAGRGVMGASFGAVASLSAAWRRPETFGRLLLQSGSFGFSDIGRHHRGPEFDPVVNFVNAFRASPGRPAARAFVSCGIHESLIYENRSIVPVLQRTGMELRYVGARDGHNWENWRDRLREGLSWLFPGPLWITYE
jgi:enterochelin esterase family protein